MVVLPTDGASIVDLVNWVRDVPYGRSSDRTIAGMLREHRGTCSTKHLFLAHELERRFPETEPRIVHRVYTMMPDAARRQFGGAVAAVVPPRGVVDVHRYLTVSLGSERVVIDATFPAADRWDGRSPMRLACGPGSDRPAGADPDRDKLQLGSRYCDTRLREALVEAIIAST